MSILKDYIAYARSYVNPKLSEEAAQYLIQAYVGKETLVIDCLPNNICVRWRRYSWLKIFRHSTPQSNWYEKKTFWKLLFSTSDLFPFLVLSSVIFRPQPLPRAGKDWGWEIYSLPSATRTFECWPFNWSSSGYQYVILPLLTPWKGATMKFIQFFFPFVDRDASGW